MLFIDKLFNILCTNTTIRMQEVFYVQEKTETVKDFMVSLSDYPSVSQDTTLEQAVNIMYRMSKEKGYRWLVVQDDNGNISGFLTLRNVMEAISNLAPKASGWMGIFSYGSPGFFYWEGVQSIKNTPVRKLIQPFVDVFVQETGSPATVAEIILKRRVTIVPVVNDKMKVVGIVRPVDLLPFFKRLFENAPG